MLRYTYDPPYNQWYGVKNKNLLRFKVTYGGTVATVSDLPSRGFMPGVMFNVQEDGSNYMWNGLTWDKMDSNPFVGATSSKDGIQGLVPKPETTDQEAFLYGSGGWKELDASDIKTGVFDIARIPAAALERLVTVADQTERYALTASTVQNGDTVLQSDTQVMYRVVDQTKLDESAGYVEYQAARASVVPWSGVTSAPAFALDNSVVHTTSDETIAGVKTFSDNIVLSAQSPSMKSDGTTKAVRIFGGKEDLKGAVLCAYGPLNGVLPGGFKFYAATDNDHKTVLQGAPDGTLQWSGQSIQTSSDERLKTSLAVVPDEVLDAWEAVGWGEFKFLEAVERKGESARLHLGLIAQRVKDAFEARGLDACSYGILCHEECPATESEPAIDVWMIRYTEALAMEAAYQRRRADRLEARIAALEVKLV